MLSSALARMLAALCMLASLASPASGQLGIPCAPGSWSANGFEPCVACAPGTFTGFQGADHCETCPAGSYAAESGATACTACSCDDGVVCTVESCAAATGACDGAAHDRTCRAVFRRLGQLPEGTWSSAADVSADGSVVVGWAEIGFSHHEAVRWTREEGLVGLGDLPGGDFHSEARAVSADGTLVVGSSDGTGTTPFGSQAFAWTGATGMQALPGANPTGDASAAGVSDDGSTIVGYHYFDANFSAFRADPAMSQVVGLKLARDASADGSVVVGHDGTAAQRWTGAGAEPLGMLGSDNHSEATAVTPDGEVVVGWSYLSGSSFGGSEPFRWTPGGGMVGLGHRSERVNQALDVNASGALIVGTIESGGTTAHRAFVWTEHEGVRTVHDMLAEDYGVTLPGWTLSSAKGVSADGSVIVGDGSSPEGPEEGWILTVPDASAGASALAACGALAGLAALRRRVSPRPARRR